MATNIQIKRGSGSNTPSSLLQGELAVNMDTGQLYYGSGSTKTPVNSYKFTNVTASGDISASGTVSALSYTGLPSGLISGSSQLPSGIISSSAQLPSGIYSSSTQILGNITSSGNISASGYVSASSFIGDGSQLTNVVADEATLVEIECKNTSGGTLTKGTPVYITGTVGASSRVEVSAASASLSAKMPAIGLLKQDLANNGEGFIVIGGLLTNLSTDPINGDTPNEGDVLYVHPDGGLALNKPSGSNLIQNVGKVGKVNGSGAGSIIVSSILRSNDVPNLLESQIFFGSGSNQTQQIHISGALDSTVINHITSSGNISSSGYVSASSFSGDGSGLTNISATLPAGVVSSSLQFTNTDDVTFRNITGSKITVGPNEAVQSIIITGSSADRDTRGGSINVPQRKFDLYIEQTSDQYFIIASNADAANIGIGYRSDAIPTTAYFNISGSTFVRGHVTASGNVSSSGDLFANTGSFNYVTTPVIEGSGSTTLLNIEGDVSASGYVSASSFIGSGSQILGVVSASYALTASHALNGGGGSVPAGTVSSSAQIVTLGFAQTSSATNVTFGNISSSANISGSNVFASSTISASGTIYSELIHLTNTTTDDSLTIETTEDSSTAAPVITLKRNSSSPDDGDYLGQLKFKGENDADQEVVYAKITAKIGDVTDTTEDGLIETAVRKAGSNAIVSRQTSTDLKLINGTGLEVAGDIQTDSNITVSGNINASGDLEINNRVLVSSSLSSAGSTSGDIVKIGNVTTVAGLMYALTGSAGGWTLASSGSGQLATSSLAIALGTNSTTNGMLLRGMVNIGHDPGGISGGAIYLADGGSASYASSTTSNHVVRVIGHNYENNVIYFNPSNDWIVRS